MSDGVSLYTRLVRTLSRIIPAPLAAVLDLLRPSVAAGFGGPFNGQELRIAAVRDVFTAVPFASIVETGTFRATTTLFLRTLSRAPLVTVEANSRFFHYSRLRLLFRDATVIRGDSATVLHALTTSTRWSRSPAFFYLDAHWLDALPLPREVEIITTGWRDFVVLIDDFRVPDDPGYGYDDYGVRGALEVGILAPVADKGIVVYWPSANSTVETGARRGWVVLASLGAVDDALRQLTTLRRTGMLAAVVAGNPAPGDRLQAGGRGPRSARDR